MTNLFARTAAERDLACETYPGLWPEVAALEAAGLPVQSEPTIATPRSDQRAATVDAAFWCRQLCLPQDRVDEVADMVATLEFPRERVTIWWDR